MYAVTHCLGRHCGRRHRARALSAVARIIRAGWPGLGTCPQSRSDMMVTYSFISSLLAP